MNTYTIVAGVDGVGKSSLIGILKTETKIIGRVLNADECLEKGICFTQEATLSGHN